MVPCVDLIGQLEVVKKKKEIILNLYNMVQNYWKFVALQLDYGVQVRIELALVNKK